MKEEFFFPHQDLNHGPLELKASSKKTKNGYLNQSCCFPFRVTMISCSARTGASAGVTLQPFAGTEKSGFTIQNPETWIPGLKEEKLCQRKVLGSPGFWITSISSSLDSLSKFEVERGSNLPIQKFYRLSLARGALFPGIRWWRFECSRTFA